ncbi:EAL domain-containing protein [Pseudoalteromonas sp. SR45-6]|uniref:putative bifunctional diguanylate cyclase/phosphodiesterase n=1 Tax=Pseudoalteromonas sp. SR45-6 TaxID=2760927 RepID=UPI0015FF551C|nr:GGDEF domain-containing phosphodiesterase [Pseudoalteromonas sp. SR45-6]MBB1340288.1 EAL domain-containing protein [Pseudoalteromonas sp. SR45-6]
MHYLSRYFLLSDHVNSNVLVPNWRISALRIILTAGVILCFSVFCHTLNAAIEFNLIYIIVLAASFSVTMATLLIASRKYFTLCAHALLLSIVAATISMNVFLTDINLAKVGSMYMYACPIIALMLLGVRTALGYAILNIVPFYFIINNVDISSLTSINTQLPNSDWYISGLLFLFFNICIPLAVARTIVAAKRLNQTMAESNSHLAAKNELYRTFFTESSIAKIIIDSENTVIDFNSQAKMLFDFKATVKNSTVKLDKLLPNLVIAANPQKNQVFKYKNTYKTVHYQQVTDSDYCVLRFDDCTEQHQIKQNLLAMEQENKRLRYSDGQTHLPNREWFELQCERFVAKYQGDFYIVITQSANNEYLNLKYSKADAKAHLVSAYKRLKDSNEDLVLCAHVGNNKLAFIITTSSANKIEYKLLNEVKHALDEPYIMRGRKYQQSFLFGFSNFPRQGKSSATVLNNAIEALKLADNHRPINGYDEKRSQAFLEKHEISMLLDEALHNAELELHYQPKVTHDGKCIGLEALARWNSKTLGVVSPAVFIPIAEEYRMISRLTDLIIQKVCTQIATWSKDEIPLVPVAINISLLDFGQSDFMSKLVKYLADFNVKPSQIELELTETSLEANQEYSLALMQNLQSWGFTISVDDFGVGYSNIARLAEYPINKLKLDRSLISQVTSSTRQKSLVKAIHVMCDELGIKCVSEGVETQQQVEIMANMGCKEFQGFYFSKPLSAYHYTEHIKQQGLNFNPQKIPTS